MTWALKRVVSIVEGLGEELAVPRLVARWVRQHRLFRQYVAEEPAICAKGVGKLICTPGLQRGVEYFVGVALAREPHGILIVFDADKECQRRASTKGEPLGVEIFRRARAIAPPEVEIAVVVADREFEAWFIEHRHVIGLPAAEAWPGTPAIEAIANCKKLVGRMLARRYDPVIDQPTLAMKLPLPSATSAEIVRGGRSYRKLITSLARLMPPTPGTTEGEAGAGAKAADAIESPTDNDESTDTESATEGS